MTTQELVNYYKALLIIQYSSQSKALATIDAYIAEFIQNQVIQQVQDGFDLETAIGAQLTMLGTYVGAPRVVFGLVAGQYWSLVPVTAPDPSIYFGWASVSGPAPTTKWLKVNDTDSVPYTLSDNQLRRLIRLMAGLRSSALTLEDLDNILYSAFGTYVNLLDNENMSIVYQHQTADPDPDKLFEIAVLAGALPHPAGVSFSVQEV